MAGGIQYGMSATSDLSKKLDGYVKEAAREIAGKYPEIPWKRGISRDTVDFLEIGMEPDGGVFFHPNPIGKATLPALVTEGKYQGDDGNAIERWFRYYTNFNIINPCVTFLTFCAGPGAAEGKKIPKTLSLVHGGANNYNKIKPHSLTTFMSEVGFTYEFIRDVIEQVLIESL